MGIEPTPSAWKAEVLPLNYTRLPALTPACRSRPLQLFFTKTGVFIKIWWRGKDSNLRSFRGRFTVCSLWPLGNLSIPAADFTLPNIDVKPLFLLNLQNYRPMALRSKRGALFQSRPANASQKTDFLHRLTMCTPRQAGHYTGRTLISPPVNACSPLAVSTLKLPFSSTSFALAA